MVIIWTEFGGFVLLFYIWSRITKVKSDMQLLRELYIQETDASSNDHVSLDFCSCITKNIASYHFTCWHFISVL